MQHAAPSPLWPVDEAAPAPAFDGEPVARPVVAARARGGRGYLGYGAIVLSGVVVLAAMTSQRTSADAFAAVTNGAAPAANFVAPEPLPADAAAASMGGAAAAAAGAPAIAAPQFAVDNAVTPATPVPMTMSTMPAVETTQAGTPAAAGGSRLAAPAMIVDLSDPGSGGARLGDPGRTTGTALANPALAAAGGPDAAGRSGIAPPSMDSQFLASSGPTQSAQASRIGNMAAIVAEGTVIAATLETAIDSDLPGLARAVISRNVMSFDGTRVLIPRGSRVVGQYKSGVAMGGSRVFVIWTRLIRSDGVAIQLASPSGDDLGRGGLGGKVDRHFFQRFGGSLLTSVLSGGVSLGTAAIGGGVPVYINSVAEAGQAAASAVRTGDIPPTVKTPQGTSLKIFVARDLDFAGLGVHP